MCGRRKGSHRPKKKFFGSSQLRLVPRPLVQDPHALPDCQPNARPLLHNLREYALRLVEAAAGIEHELNPQPVAAPLLDLVEIAAVGVEWIVGLLLGPIIRTHWVAAGQLM